MTDLGDQCLELNLADTPTALQPKCYRKVFDLDNEPMKIRNSLHEFIPPIFLRPRHLDSPQGEQLFDGEDLLFRQLMHSCTTYGEYGIGLSTITAFQEYQCDITAVDTSQEWINAVARRGVNLEDKRVDIQWIDVGPLSDWGRPTSYAKSSAFPQYAASIWERESLPDLVLIDGRFRVACFLKSLLSGTPGTRILFDDYTARIHYHVVERIVTPTEMTSRQALFIIPETFDMATAHRMYEQFLMVMD